MRGTGGRRGCGVRGGGDGGARAARGHGKGKIREGTLGGIGVVKKEKGERGTEVAGE